MKKLSKSLETIREELLAAGFVIYGSHTGKLTPGMYIGLFHGFVSDEDRALCDDWGAYGPCIGPLNYVQTTYGCHTRMEFSNRADIGNFAPFLDMPKTEVDIAVQQGDPIDLEDDGTGCLLFNGVQYGDRTVFHVKE